jgi:hypothetical protein
VGFAVAVTAAAFTGGQVIFQVAVAMSDGQQGIQGGFGQGRAAEVGVQDDAGGIDDRDQARLGGQSLPGEVQTTRQQVCRCGLGCGCWRSSARRRAMASRAAARCSAGVWPAGAASAASDRARAWASRSTDGRARNRWRTSGGDAGDDMVAKGADMFDRDGYFVAGLEKDRRLPKHADAAGCPG